MAKGKRLAFRAGSNISVGQQNKTAPALPPDTWIKPAKGVGCAGRPAPKAANKGCLPAALQALPFHQACQHPPAP